MRALPPFNGSWLGASRRLPIRCSVRGACIVRINQLPTSMADADGCRDDDKAYHHSDRRHRVNECRFPKCRDQDCRHEREADSPHELFGVFLVSLDRRVRNDTFDPLLLTFTSIHGEEPAAEQHGLNRDDSGPGAARPNSTSP
jgi:hypothetical protein